MRSQMFNLPTSRSNSPLLLELADPPPKKRKSKVSFENTSASAADKSSSAEDTTIFASTAEKSPSAEDTPTPPLSIRLSEAIDQRTLQLGSSKIPEKEHSALEGGKEPSSESGNTPLAARKSSRACPPWGDGEDSPLPALHAENPLANNRTGSVPVSERHKFKAPSSSPKMNARHGLYDSTDEGDDSSPTSAVGTVREVIRKGGSPLDNLQWSSQLAKNLAEEERNTKSPPGTPQSHELEVEKVLLRPTLAAETPSRIPLEHRLTEEELRLREARKALGRLTSLVSSVANDESLSSSVDPMARALRGLNESLQVIANVNDDLMDDTEFDAAKARFNSVAQESSSAAVPSVNCGAGTDEDRATWSAFLNKDRAPLAATGPVLDVTGNEEEGNSSSVSSPGVYRPDFDEDERLLTELEERSKLGLLDTLQDTRVAFQTLLGENEVNGEMDMYIPHSFTYHSSGIHVLPTN
jgi:hypothetical protein